MGGLLGSSLCAEVIVLAFFFWGRDRRSFSSFGLGFFSWVCRCFVFVVFLDGLCY